MVRVAEPRPVDQCPELAPGRELRLDYPARAVAAVVDEVSRSRAPREELTGQPVIALPCPHLRPWTTLYRRAHEVLRRA
jgi:hypothetical protein